MSREKVAAFQFSIATFLSRQRLRAFTIHLALSALVFATLLFLLYEFWFPRALFNASGGWEGLRIVALVDIVLGPLLTFVVYDIAKRRAELVRDLGIIAGMQLVCLLLGVSIVYSSRPVAVVHVFDTFHVIRQSDFEVFGVDSAPLQRFEGRSPKVLFAEVEDNPVAFLAGEVLGQLNQALPKHMQVDLYREPPASPGDVRSLLHPNELAGDRGCVLQNISSAFGRGTICFDPETLSFADFTPGASVSFRDSVELRLN